MSWPNNTGPRAWLSRLNWKRSLDAAAARWSPELFRHLTRVCEGDARTLRDLIQPWQERDFAALDAAWIALAHMPRAERAAPAEAGCRRAYLERPRGHSKTFDTALQIAWILTAARRPVRGLAAAADKDQSLLLWQSVERLARFNRHLTLPLRFTADRIRNEQTGSRIDFITSDVGSSYGHDPDFVICDELCHWEKEELWQSLFSSAAKRRQSVLLILSNAGTGRGWQWDVREMARTAPGWHFSRLEGPQAPWITAESLAEQRSGLPRPVYDRLWLNIWQHSDGEFVTLEEAQACRDPARREQQSGQPGFGYVAAIDYAEKHDLTVGCLVHCEGRRVVVDRMDVVRPSPERPTPVQWVEDWIHRIARDFGNVRFVVDEYQLVGVIQRLERSYRMERFRFASGTGNHELATTLHRLIVEKQVVWYPGCGAVAGNAADPRGTADDLETELAALVTKESRGRIRFDHVPGKHDDRSFTLGAACVTALKEEGGGDFLEIQEPPGDGVFRW